MQRLVKGRFVARLAQSPADIVAAQTLRYRAFRTSVGKNGRDMDAYDADCSHVLIEDSDAGRAVGCYRIMTFCDGLEIEKSYSAQFYDLAALVQVPGPMIELGRFCIDRDYANDPDILRIAWGSLTRIVDESDTKMLFGCTSFAGTDARKYDQAFGVLNNRHLAPSNWRPGRISLEAVVLADVAAPKPDRRQAMAMIPPLLRTYLMMGGWVGDHAVVDRDLNTLHVFTAVEIAKIPASRANLLRELAK